MRSLGGLPRIKRLLSAKRPMDTEQRELVKLKQLVVPAAKGCRAYPPVRYARLLMLDQNASACGGEAHPTASHNEVYPRSSFHPSARTRCVSATCECQGLTRDMTPGQEKLRSVYDCCHCLVPRGELT